MKRVLLIQRVLPAYRLKFFQQLSALPDFEFTFAYGSAPLDSAIDSLENPVGLKTLKLANSFFGKDERASFQKGVIGLIGSGNFDAVIAEYNPRIISSVFGYFYARIKGVKFLWWGHGFGPSAGKLSKFLRMFMTKKADALILYGNAQATRLAEAGMPSEKIFVAPNSIDLDEIKEVCEPWENDKRDSILYIGRLRPEKKVSLLLRAFAKSLKDIPNDTRLIIIGEGPLEQELKNLAQELNIPDRTDFVGAHYPQEKLAPYFARSLLSVSPGGVGLSAIHSLAYGLPMLVADNEPHGPEVDALTENGIFFKSEDVEDFSNHIIKMLGDKNMLAKMSKAGCEHVFLQFSTANMVSSFEKALNFALDEEVKA